MPKKKSDMMRSHRSRAKEIEDDIKKITSLQQALADKYFSHRDDFLKARPFKLKGEDLLHRLYTNVAEDYQALALMFEHDAKRDYMQMVLHNFDLWEKEVKKEAGAPKKPKAEKRPLPVVKQCYDCIHSRQAPEGFWCQLANLPDGSLLQLGVTSRVTPPNECPLREDEHG